MRLYDPKRFKIGEMRGGEFIQSTDDNADVAPRSVVIDDSDFDWGTSTKPTIERGKRVIVELHPKSATRMHPGVPEYLQGTYAGMMHPEFLKELQGRCTSIELVVQAAASEPFLLENDKINYWGYNPLGAFYAPDPEYALADDPQEVVREVKQLIKTYHEHGIEVFIDVIYNHTAEGGDPFESPTFSLRALDKRYYKTSESGYPNDLTGCGNTLDMDFEPTRALALNSLRYWKQEMQVDGIRFDLATVLGAVNTHYKADAPFYKDLKSDPLLRENAVSESWGGFGFDSGYQVGNVPMEYEWNGPYQERMRLFWGGNTPDERHSGIIEFSQMITGSAQLFQHSPEKHGASSINYIIAHDGFTLWDLVSFNSKHNEANGEGNRDGKTGNCSWNSGHEGPTDNPHITALRLRRAKAMMASLFLSQGTPMYSLGDLVLHSQEGNNNAYCQDNELNWIDWRKDPSEGRFKQFIGDLFTLRTKEPLLSRASFDGSEALINWHRSDGRILGPRDWHTRWAKNINLMITEPGESMTEKTAFFIAVNGSFNDMPLTLPTHEYECSYSLVCDSSAEVPFDQNLLHKPGATVTLPHTSVMIFRLTSR